MTHYGYKNENGVRRSIVGWVFLHKNGNSLTNFQPDDFPTLWNRQKLIFRAKICVFGGCRQEEIAIDLKEKFKMTGFLMFKFWKKSGPDCKNVPQGYFKLHSKRSYFLHWVKYGDLEATRLKINSPFFGNSGKTCIFLETAPVLMYFCRSEKIPFIIVSIQV